MFSLKKLFNYKAERKKKEEEDKKRQELEKREERLVKLFAQNLAEETKKVKVREGRGWRGRGDNTLPDVKPTYIIYPQKVDHL